MRRLFSSLLILAGSVLWADGVAIAEASSGDSVLDTRDTLGAKLVHGTVRISPVAAGENDGATLLVDDASPEDWSTENPMWDSTAVTDGVHEAVLYESENPSTAQMVALNSGDYVYEGGEIEGEVTWSNDAIHIVQYGVKVPENASLTVTDGAVVKLTKGAEIIADGTMTAGKGAVFGSLAEADIPGQVEITVDDALSDSSTNPVQNKVVNAAIVTLQGSDSTMQADITELKSTATTFSESLAAVENNITALQGKDTELSSSLAAVESNITALQGKDTELSSSLAAVENNITALQGKDTELSSSLAAAENNITALQAAGRTRDDDIAKLQADNADLKKQLDSLVALLNGGEEGQVLTKMKDGSCAWTTVKSADMQVVTLSLAAGWNLVAMPGQWLIEESDQALLDEIEIYTFDRATQIYTHADGLKPLTSYWFRAKEACTIHFIVKTGEEK